MSLAIAESASFTGKYQDPFADLSDVYSSPEHRATPEDYQRHGRYAITDGVILETPADVLGEGHVLTNPSQIERVPRDIASLYGDEDMYFAYFRKEPRKHHLGLTTARPYLIQKHRDGTPYLTEFAEAMEVQGEDPRLIPNMKIKGQGGKVHTGWAIGTVIARRNADDPTRCDGICTRFTFGETLDRMETVLEVPETKNVNPYPLANISGNPDDTRLDVFGRPSPDITLTRNVPDLSRITRDMLETGTNITRRFLPKGVHTGVNNIKGDPRYPDYRELDIHEATAPVTEAGKELNYRIGRYGLNVRTGRVIMLGVVADRADFPYADPKPRDSSIYDNVTYGSLGNPDIGMMVTGLSDSSVGIANIVRVR